MNTVQPVAAEMSSKVPFITVIIAVLLIAVIFIVLTLAYKNRYAIRSWIMEEEKLPGIITYKYSRLPTGGSQVT